MTNHTFPTAKHVYIKYDLNKGRKDYLPDVRTVTATTADMSMITWEYEGKTYFDLHITWFSVSTRPIIKYEADVFSGSIIKMIVTQF